MPTPTPAPQIHQISSWDVNAKFEISGADLRAICDLAAVFRPVVYLANSLLKQAQLDGKVTHQFVDGEGNPADPIHIEAALRQAGQTLGDLGLLAPQ